MLRARDLQDRTLVDFSSIRNGEDIRRVLEHLAAHRQDVVRHLMKEAERRFGRNVETAVHVLAALPAGGMVGVTMDGNGIPIDLDILEDGASDADLLEGIGRTADLHGLKRLTVISDCAFENPACLQASGFGFAVSAKICDDGLAKRMPAPGGWPRLYLEDEEDVFRFGLIEPDEAGPQGLAMIATRSTGRALEDLHELEFSKHGLDADGFLFRRLWAGVRVIRTNLTNESPERIVRLVESLSGMVEPFRLEKSASDPVPTGDALKGCIVSAWISLVMEKVVMRVLKETKEMDLTAHQLRQVLREAEVALEDVNPQVPFFLRLHEGPVFDDMLAAFGLKLLCRLEEKASLRRKLRLKTFPPMA